MEEVVNQRLDESVQTHHAKVQILTIFQYEKVQIRTRIVVLL